MSQPTIRVINTVNASSWLWMHAFSDEHDRSERTKDGQAHASPRHTSLNAGRKQIRDSRPDVIGGAKAVHAKFAGTLTVLSPNPAPLHCYTEDERRGASEPPGDD